MAGNAYSLTDARAVGPWTSMVAYPAQQLPSRWSQDGEGITTSKGIRDRLLECDERPPGGRDQNPLMGDRIFRQ